MTVTLEKYFENTTKNNNTTQNKCYKEIKIYKSLDT